MPATENESKGFTLPLALRFFFATALLIALALGAAVFVTYHQGQRIAADALQKAVATSDAVQREFEQHGLEMLQSNARLIAADSGFARYIGSAAGGGALPGVEGQSGPDLSSMRDLLLERQRNFDFDLGVLLDGQGNTLARTDRAEAVQESLAEDPLVAAALHDTPPFSGYWRQREALYQATIMPIVQDKDLLGYLLIAQAVDDTLAQKVAQASGAQVAFRIPLAGKASLAASSLDKPAATALTQALAALDPTLRSALDSSHAIDEFRVHFADQDWVARARPMAASGDAKLGSVIVLASADRFVSGYRMILNWVLLAGAVSMIAALLLSLLLSKRILSPVRTMALAAEEAAGGNYQARIGSGGSDELGRLSRAFDTLLSELREKSDMEGYVGHLARFLPEPVNEGVAEAPTRRRASSSMAPRRARATLLGVEFRHLLADKPDVSPQQSATETLALKARLDELARVHGAELHVAEGARWFFAFEGEAAHRRALACWSALLEGAVAHRHAAPSGAVTDGELLHDGEFLLGMAQAQVHRLLCDATAGQLLTLTAFAEALAHEYGDAATQGATGAYSAKPRTAVLASTWERAAKDSVPADQTVMRSDQRAAAASAVRTPAPISVSPGSVLGNRYRIVSVLGEGGMGVVYKAHDLELNDLVALKMLKPGALADGSQLERLKDEIKLARRITHPNVLRTFDFGEIGGLPYISMEYVRGLTLRYLLRDAKRVPYSAGLRVARQLAAGLGAAHAVGVLHRDIKPENLILEANANAKLMDFGIARPASRVEPGHTAPGTFLGTPNYCAPEQLAGEEVDERADLYSCGVLMTEMFCGALPYSGKSTMDIYIAQMQQEPTRPSVLWPEIPPDLETVILRCLQRAPSERYASASELAAALARLRV